MHVVLCAVLLAPPIQAESTRPSREHEIKAAAFRNIIAFTEWPETTFGSEDSPLVIGVLGRGEIATLLEEFIGSETWRGRNVVVRPVSNPIEARSCHALYIAQSERARWLGMNGQLAGAPILTVSDIPDFARKGGTVEFAIQRNKLRLIVNLRATRDCGLTISSKVLRLSDVIDEKGS